MKGADAGLVRVLGPAARMAGLTLHLCQVHIHEEGAAEPGASAYRRRRGGWHDGGASDFSVDPSASFEVIEVSDRRWELDSWVDAEDRPSDLGTLVLGEEELLPAEGFVRLLAQAGLHVALLKRFIVEVVAETFDGSETDALIPAAERRPDPV